MFSDDHYPLDIANRISQFNFNQKFWINGVHNGLLFAPSYLLFGPGYEVSFYTMIILGISSIILLFLLTEKLTKNYWVALYTTLLMSFNVTHIRFSLSTYNHMPSFFFALLTLYAFFLSLKHKKNQLLYLSLFSLGYLVFLRTEFILFVLFMLPFYIKHKHNNLKDIKTWLPWLVFFVLISISLPLILNRSNMISNPGGPTHSSMSFDNFLENVKDTPRYIGISNIQLFFLFLGLCYFILKRNKNIISLTGLSALFITLYLFINKVTLEGRYFIFSLSIFYIVIGQCIYLITRPFKKIKVRTFLNLFIFFLLIILLLNNAHETNLKLKNSVKVNKFIFDTKLPAYIEKNYEECRIFSVQPVRYTATTRLNVKELNLFSKERNNCTLFIEDFSCEYPKDSPRVQQCINFKQTHELTLHSYIDSTMIEIPNKNTVLNYTLYRVI